MKATVRNTLVSLLGSAGVAYAAGGPESEGSGLLLALFLGFGALVILFQTLPGVILFSSMLKGIFSAFSKKAVTASGKDDRRA